MQRHARSLLLAALLAAALAAPAAAGEQSWNYKSYKRGGAGGQLSKDRFVTGTITLEEKDGKAFYRMNAGETDACVRGEIPALVTRTDATTTIEPQISLAGCEKFRLVIRNDGSGGHRERWRNESWRDSGWDHDLTPVK